MARRSRWRAPRPASAAPWPQTYDSLVERWLAMIRQRGRLTWITNGSGALVPVVPLLLAAPKYLSGEMSLGGVVQVAAAFVAVQNAFNWLLDNFMRIAEWLAAARRVNELADALVRVDGDAAARPSDGAAQPGRRCCGSTTSP